MAQSRSFQYETACMLRRLLWIALGFLAACTPAPAPAPVSKAVPSLKQSGELVVLVRNGPTSFYLDSDGLYAGLDYDLLTLFSNRLGVKVKFVVAPRVAEMADRLAAHEAHLAVGMTVHDDKRVQFGPGYLNVQPALVYRADADQPRNLGELDDGVLMAGSLYVPVLKQQVAKYPKLHWDEAQYQDTEDLVEKVANGLIDYAVADANDVGVALNYHPNAQIAFNIGQPIPLAWAWANNMPPDFADKVAGFFAQIRKDGTLARLIDRYYGHAKRLQTDDATAFLEKRVSVLPHYTHYFIDAEAQYGIDWRLLAALSYQESHWDPTATSAYGVRGIMMLTTSTADKLGVSNRLDPAESIMGGAKYLDMMKATLPPSVVEPDRSWLTLAVYNIGSAHLEDARVLAQRMGKNPNSWTDLKTVIPLLRNYEYFSTLKYGFARGGETVIFVENVRSYYDILVRFEKPAKLMFPPFDEKVTVANPEGVLLGIDAKHKDSKGLASPGGIEPPIDP
ncbi:MAG: membrane-bound lytic murein transglycosylase MltF [Burkholderiales bacterium]|nr:membrane-bound lytic murein transglycosylase MltF [Burkholderiales bacterium]